MTRHSAAAVVSSLAAAAALVVVAVLGSAPGALATGAEPVKTLRAAVVSAGPDDYRIQLTEGGRAAGRLHLTECGEGSAVSYFCAGTATIPGVHALGRVRIRWQCPPGKGCAAQARGLVKNRGSVLAILVVKAKVKTLQTKGAAFTVVAEMTPE